MKHVGISILGLFLFTAACGPQFEDVTGGSKQGSEAPKKQEMIKTPVIVEYVAAGGGMSLAGATAYTMNLAGCASGHTATVNEVVASLKVYKYDTGCLAKLAAFSFGGINWIPTAGTPFTTWLAGDKAKFEDALDPANTMTVSVIAQLASPVDPANTVHYKFSEIDMGPDQSIPQGTVGDAHVLTVDGQGAPDFKVSSVRFVGMSVAGAGKFEFTMECANENITGAGATTACKDTVLANVNYKLVKDTWGGTLTIDDAAALFPAGASTIAIPGELVAIGAGGTVHGGFITKAGASALAGPDQMHLNPDMILIFEAAGLSYQYFNVDVTTLTQP